MRIIFEKLNINGQGFVWDLEFDLNNKFAI